MVYGDIDCNNSIDISDVVLLARYVAEDTTITISAQGVLNADCDKNNVVDSSDITAICRYLAHLTDAV